LNHGVKKSATPSRDRVATPRDGDVQRGAGPPRRDGSGRRSLKFHRAADAIDVGRELAAGVLDDREKPTLEN
jgi:hypothetical protein